MERKVYCLALLDARVGRYIVGHPDVASDDRMVSNGDASQDRSIGIDSDMILYDGMAGNVQHIAVLVVSEALRTQCHTLIERDVIADDCCLADDYACTVVNSEILAYLSTRMDVDTCLRVCLLSDDTWQYRHLHLV